MTIAVSVQEGIATVTLDRPEKRNAMNAALIHDLAETLKKLASEKEVRVLILNGNGEHFCAGADIDGMRKIAESSDGDNRQDARQLAMLMQMIYRFPKPVIALAHGATLGGGLGLVAAADIAIAANNASFGFSEVKIGIVPSVISPYVLAAIGERAARYYFLTAERFHASEAHRLGLVHQVVDPSELFSTALTVAGLLLKNSPAAIKEAKFLIQHVSHHELTDDLIQFTADHLAKMRKTPDAREGLQAFLDKRAPEWS